MSQPQNNEPRYDVLWPLSRKAVKKTAAATRLPDLNGKTIVELWDVIFRGETIYPLVREYIKKRFPGVKFVDHREFGNFHGARERDVQTPHRARATREGPDRGPRGAGDAEARERTPRPAQQDGGVGLAHQHQQDEEDQRHRV